MPGINYPEQYFGKLPVVASVVSSFLV